ncbi:MAG: DUF4189 domain-containing protein [Rhizobiales bacterium]|nr:DUF4189 domain-containing protein [Hyphomicrobiales bacterium]
MKVIALIVAALIFCLGTQASFAKDNYAALAVVWKQGKRFHGLGYGSSLAAAKKAAVEECRNKRCVVATVYRPGQCIHLVMGAYQIFWNNDGFGPGESKNVMNFCKKQDPSCRKMLSQCLPK